MSHIQNVGAGGGSSTLAGLTDVLLTSPTDGQVLCFNGGAGKWENDQRIYGAPGTALSHPGKTVTIRAGAGYSTGVGGTLYFAGGTGNLASGSNGGPLSFVGGYSKAGAPGNATLYGGAQFGGVGTHGGYVKVYGGTVLNGVGSGGLATLRGGTVVGLASTPGKINCYGVGSVAGPGNIIVTAGDGGTLTHGAALYMRGGTTTTAGQYGGSAQVKGGSATTGNAGGVGLYGGGASSTGGAGNVTIQGGANTGAPGGPAGHARIYGGAVTTPTGSAPWGNVYIAGGGTAAPPAIGNRSAFAVFRGAYVAGGSTSSVTLGAGKGSGANAGSGAYLQLFGGYGAGTNYNGGTLRLLAGTALVNGVGGSMAVYAGNGSGTGAGGTAYVIAGIGGISAGSIGANAALVGGSGAGTAGLVRIYGGVCSNNGPGGDARVVAGAAGVNGGKGGNIVVTAGAGQAAGAAGGDITITLGVPGAGGTHGKLIIAQAVSSPGAAVGTLTNAPHAVNPSFWLTTTINGTICAIPAWTV